MFSYLLEYSIIILIFRVNLILSQDSITKNVLIPTPSQEKSTESAGVTNHISTVLLITNYVKQTTQNIIENSTYETKAKREAIFSEDSCGPLNPSNFSNDGINKSYCRPNIPGNPPGVMATSYNFDGYLMRVNKCGKNNKKNNISCLPPCPISMIVPQVREKKTLIKRFVDNQSNVSAIVIDNNTESNESKYTKAKMNNHKDDEYYDNELINKLTYDNGRLPEGLHVVTSKTNEQFLLYKDQKNDNLNLSPKRDAAPPDYDYNYYEDNSVEKLTSKFIGDPYHFSKHKGTRSTRTTRSVRKNVKKIKNDENEDGSTTELAVKLITKNGKETTYDEIDTKGGSTYSNNGFLENIKSRRRSKIKSVPRKKTTCIPEEAKRRATAVCHPKGGVPKRPGVPMVIKKPPDPEYEKTLKGETSENIVNSILKKVAKNPKMSTELGLCEVDMKDLKDLMKDMRSKRVGCCVRLQGEFRCFMNWLLSQDPTRRKRTLTLAGAADAESCNLCEPNNMDVLRLGRSGVRNIRENKQRTSGVSSQYMKLIDKMLSFKGQEEDAWPSSPRHIIYHPQYDDNKN